MKALWFLTWRLLVNSVRRALRHPVRAVFFALMVAFFGFIFTMSVVENLSGHRTAYPMPPPSVMPSDQLVALIMLIHLSMLWSALSSSAGSSTMPVVSQADVNFLFPSPLRRLHVFLFLLLVRGLFTSIFALLILVVMVLGVGNELIARVITGLHRTQTWVVWAYPVMYLLAYIGLLATGMVILLKEERQEGFRARLRLFFWGAFGLLGGALTWYAVSAYREGKSPLEVIVWNTLHNPLLAVPLVPLRALAEAAIGFYQGWTPYITVGFVVWGSITLCAFLLLARQESWLYELGTKLASMATTYRTQRQNPLMLAQDFAVRRAGKRRGKREWSLLQHWTPQGVWALWWCNAILLMRMGGYLLTSVLLMLLGITVMTVASVLSRHGDMLDPEMAIILQHSGTFFVLAFSQTWITNTLKRAELTRSLPFPARQVVLAEVFPTTLLLMLFLTAYWAICSALLVKHIYLLTYSYVVGLSLALPLNLCVMLVSLANPDPADYTQRTLLGLLLFPVALIAALPTVVAVVFALILGLPLWLNALLVALVNVGVAWALTSAAGESYALMNLSE